MKNRIRPSYYSSLIILIILILSITACTKTEYLQTFDDVFDISGILDLNHTLDSAKSVDALSDLFKDVQVDVPALLDSMTTDQILSCFELNNRMSDSEIDMLLKNDPETLTDVLDRFGALPFPLIDSTIDYTDLKSSKLGKYLLSQKEDLTIYYYPNDCYSAVLEMQNYMYLCVIQPLKKLRELSLISQDGNSKGGNKEEKCYKFVIMNHHHEMCEQYKKYKDHMHKIKHKGGSGSSH